MLVFTLVPCLSNAHAGADHDPLDVLVLMQEPVVPFSFLRAKPIGVMQVGRGRIGVRTRRPRAGCSVFAGVEGKLGQASHLRHTLCLPCWLPVENTVENTAPC